MISLRPIALESFGVRLEPLSRTHVAGLASAAADGELWKLWYTSVPEPKDVALYIEDALAGPEARHVRPWAVREPGGHGAGSRSRPDLRCPRSPVPSATMDAARKNRLIVTIPALLLINLVGATAGAAQPDAPAPGARGGTRSSG